MARRPFAFDLLSGFTSRYIATMRATKISRDVRRARKWLMSSGIAVPLSYEAWDLLVRRLSVRARTTKILCLFAVVAGAVWAWLYVRSIQDQPDHARWSRDFAAEFFVLIVILIVALIIAGEMNARAERTIARSLAYRVSRTEAVTLRVILGPVRSAYFAVTVTLEAAIAIAVQFAHAGWVGWAYPVALLVVAAGVTVSVSRVLARLTVAVDPISLAIDERLRAEELFSCFSPLNCLAFAFPAVTSSGSALWVLPFWYGSWAVINIVYVLALQAPPWRRKAKAWTPPAPVPDAVSR